MISAGTSGPVLPVWSSAVDFRCASWQCPRPGRRLRERPRRAVACQGRACPGAIRAQDDHVKVVEKHHYPTGTELPGAGRHRPGHPGRHHPRSGAVHRAVRVSTPRPAHECSAWAAPHNTPISRAKVAVGDDLLRLRPVSPRSHRRLLDPCLLSPPCYAGRRTRQGPPRSGEPRPRLSPAMAWHSRVRVVRPRRTPRKQRPSA